MGKIIFWIVVIFVVLFALRLVNVAKAQARATTRRARADAAAGRADGPLRAAAASSCRKPTRRPAPERLSLLRRPGCCTQQR